MSRSTRDSELLRDSLKREKEDIWELVREEVVLMPECLRKSFGSEGRELSEDFLRNTDRLERSRLICISNSTCWPRVTSIRIRRFLSRLLLLRKMRPRELSRMISFRVREESITRKRGRENLSRKLRDNRIDNI